MKHWLGGKNELCDYLIYKIIKKAESYAAGLPWAKPLWDVTAIAWLLNDNDKFMMSRTIPAPIPQYDNTYSTETHSHPIQYVYKINRNVLMGDLFKRLGEYK